MSESNKYVKAFRKDYLMDNLEESKMADNPIIEFEKWFNSALNASYSEPNAMTLCTVSESGRPSSRIVLLREFDQNGFIFYTNYQSKKGKEMEKNRFVSLNFFWTSLEKQVRIEGSVSKISAEKSDQYFNSRPRESQIGSLASLQSIVIPNRAHLDSKVTEVQDTYKNSPIKRPETWGGYIVKPDLIEFWQGRKNRLHDRIQYTLNSDNTWIKERLSP